MFLQNIVLQKERKERDSLVYFVVYYGFENRIQLLGFDYLTEKNGKMLFRRPKRFSK